MSSAATTTDVHALEWTISDGVIRLRHWGTDQVYSLPASPALKCKIGSAESCSIRIADRLVSREHASLTHQEGRWLISDLGSKNGLRHDGGQLAAFAITPGIEIGIGATTLIAESPRSMVLHRFLARILGWAIDRRPAVDLALRSVRLAATHRVALTVAGDGDLVALAQALHRHTLGADRPFVVCDPRREHMEASVRSAANRQRGLPGLAAALGGSLCVRRDRLPPDFPAVLARLRQPTTRVQLLVCGQDHRDHEPSQAAPIHVPSLKARGSERPRIIDEYVVDAAAALAVSPTTFTRDDRAWVQKHSASSLPEIEKATLRLTALRASHNHIEAAARLGMAPVSLSRWLGRRTPPKDL